MNATRKAQLARLGQCGIDVGTAKERVSVTGKTALIQRAEYPEGSCRKKGEIVIDAPFSQYHRAALERMVQEGFERIERINAQDAAPMPSSEFQTLVAADFYLRSKTE